ncbi:MlaD family protein [Sunxiuqinia indica]|uniref:MlaD family protein n=1 Tax=Sunxiuqinia indica TaxID=2692584 RepID=UPI00135B49C1|nr:MlaD family protein [Sunxiuqinia indica]
MDNHSSNFKVRLGLFVAGGLALFVLAIFIIGKQKNLFNPVFKLTTTFYNVSGLQVGNNIRFSGINVGTVDNISIINDSTVQVGMLVRQGIKQFIKSDCIVAIGSEGLIGDRLLIITQGSTGSPLVENDQQLASVEPVETDAIISSLQITSGHVEIVTKQLAEIAIKINSGRGTLGRLIHDTIIANNINHTIVNFQNSSKEMDGMITDARSDVSAIMESFQETADNAEASTQQLEDIMVKVNTGQGTLGRLINDTVTSNNIDQTILNLKNSSKGLDENMEALKHNILFRGYFKRKAKREEQKRIEELSPETP